MSLTQETLTRRLQSAGIIRTDTLLVHSSMKSLGPVDGGPGAVLAGLAACVAEGLLVLPTLSYASVDRDHPFFSVRSTPSCVGLLTETFRGLAGVVRSGHPTHSVSALGGDAGAFVSGHELDSTPCSRNGPWGRLLDRGAKILFIGTGISCNTFLHGVEEWRNVPDYFTREPERLTVELADGTRLTRDYYRHDQHNSENYGKIRELLEAEDCLTGFTIGAADCDLLDCQKTERLVSGLLQNDIRFFFHSRPPS